MKTINDKEPFSCYSCPSSYKLVESDSTENLAKGNMVCSKSYIQESKYADTYKQSFNQDKTNDMDKNRKVPILGTTPGTFNDNLGNTYEINYSNLENTNLNLNKINGVFYMKKYYSLGNNINTTK